ncbi:unnamed protein product [Brachionus calyciflorus]|uniref:Small ribosomal subunit protein mS23 n=1 Tax=Brachionus calyciflorus TaxID=104777 RepID=A0A813ZSK6_9BILA|nr:unnamed protein product [Brachionus calyciflorus]
MAQSRINKAASIYTRLNGLIKSNLIKWSDRPLWYDIYKAFPPQRDPIYRSVLGNDVVAPLPKKLYYKEDELRAYFFKNISPIETIVLNSNMQQPNWETFISTYYEMEKMGLKKESLIDATIETLLAKGFYFKNNLKKTNNLIEQTNDKNNAESDSVKNEMKTLEGEISKSNLIETANVNVSPDSNNQKL